MSPASGKKGHGTTQLCCSIVERQLETSPSPSPRAAHLQQNPPVLLGHSALQVLFDSGASGIPQLRLMLGSFP